MEKLGMTAIPPTTSTTRPCPSITRSGVVLYRLAA
jgi:hypothetical protein